MKKIIISVVILVAIGFAGYKYVYREHRDISAEDAEFTLTAAKLQGEFTTNDSLANSKYADKTIEVAGKITSIDAAANTIVIDGKLSATLKDKVSGLQQNSPVKVKGRFVGYDDLLEEFKMDQTTIIN